MKRIVLMKIVFSLTLIVWAGLAYSQTIIRVKGSKDIQLIRQKAQLSLELLNIQENIHLTIIFSDRMPGKMKGITTSHPSPQPEKDYIIRVLIDARLGKTEQLLVLAHEMIHVKQYVKNELKILNDRKVIWKEKVYTVSHEYNRHLPWEAEAYHADLTLLKKVKTSQNQLKKILAGKAPVQISGKSPRRNYWPGRCPDNKTGAPLADGSPDS